MPDRLTVTALPAHHAGGIADEIDIPNSAGLRIGVDVGGTFTKAAAIYSRPLRIVHQVVVPTTHNAPEGVARGVVEALERLLASPTLCRFQPRVVAHSTTQAVNALLEGDTAPVGIIGMARADDRLQLLVHTSRYTPGDAGRRAPSAWRRAGRLKRSATRPPA